MSPFTANAEVGQETAESDIEGQLNQALVDCNDCLNRSDFSDALKLLDHAVDLSPGNPEILAHRGRLLLFLKEFDRARADFDKALQADSNSAAIHSGLARCHFEKGAYDLAQTCATHARTMDPANQEAGEVLSALEKLTRIAERPLVPANAPASARNGSYRGKLFARTNPQFSEDLLAGLQGRRLAIIGNATITREFGSLIDTYDAVIRLNNFRLAGFESLVGTKTDLRCTTGFRDIEHRNEHLEFSPFCANALESTHLAAFNRANARPVLTAQLDVHPFIPETLNPSTGLALVQLCAQLGLSADLFGFDGFKSPHYWQSDSNFRTTHSRQELAILLRRPNVILFGETYPYAALYDFCHANHRDYDDNAGLKLVHQLGRVFRGKTILEFGAGNGELSRYLEAETNRVTAVEVSGHAFAKIQCTRKIQGDAFTLALLREHFDVFASVDVLEHLTENDIRLVLREAARLADSLFLSVSTRPSGLLGPKGENLHLTVRSAEWWVEEAGRYFDVRLSNGYGTGQIVLEGRVKSHQPAAEFENVPQAEPSPAMIDLDSGLALEIGAHSYIHDHKIRNPSGALTDITIGKFCSIATGLTVIGYDHHSEWAAMYPFLDDGHRANWPGTNGIPYPQAPEFGSNKSRGNIEIGNDVWIGCDVKLFKGITIGNGAVIGACSMVNRSVEPYTIVAGIPARPLRKRFPDAEIELLQKIEWWNLPASLINRHMPLLCSSRIAELEQALEIDPDFQNFKQGASVAEAAVKIQHHSQPPVPPATPQLDVIQTIGPGDEMFTGDQTHYFGVGKSALRGIENALFAANKPNTDIRRILDLPCGHGRVMRYFKAAFPGAQITACDLNRGAVDFCAQTFGAQPVYSKVNTSQIPLHGKFDLIWSGSLLTHLRAEHCAEFVRLFNSLVNPGGLIVFTLHGRWVERSLATNRYVYGLKSHDVSALLAEYYQTGFGYADYPGTSGYGISVSSPAYVLAQLVSLPDLKLISYHEKGWDNHQDIVCLQKQSPAEALG